ncbi:MAG: hypothetical protein LBE91_20150 [Tannerella sp.]|jgi:hypothetical protein|nr:hypothetical protein [Tannerella sp.]
MNIKYFYKRTLYILFAVLLLATVSDCTDERVPVGPETEEGKDVLLVLNLEGLFGPEGIPNTYALTPIGDQPGTFPEDSVEDVTVFIFNTSTGACEKIMQGAYPTYNPVGPELVKSGNKNIIAVVNGNSHFSPFYTTGDEASISYLQLKRLLTDEITTNILPAAPFLMTGETSANLQPNMPASSPNNVNIAVERAVAKVKIFVTKSGNAASHTLYLHRITLNRGARQVSVLENGPSATILYDITSPATSFQPYTGGTVGTAAPDLAIPLFTAYGPSGNFSMLADTFYTFESLQDRDTTHAVCFDFEIGVNSPTNIRSCRVYLAEDSISATEALYNVYRNHWYNLYVNIIDPGMDSVEIKVIATPWNVADTIRGVVGDGHELKWSEPFKLVKYYSEDDTTRYPGSSQMLAIDTHSKGASWIDLRVTEDTPWDLNFTGGGTRNAGAIFSADTGKTWVTSLAGVGDFEWHRIYIYRPYVENSEDYRNGPVATLRVRDNTKPGSPMQTVKTLVVQPRDSLIFPTNSYVLRPFQYSGSSLSEAYIPLKPVYDFWEDFIYANGGTIPLPATPGDLSVALDWKDKSGNVIQNQTGIAVINPNNRNESYIKVEAGEVQGNAVIVFRINGAIYWSYHLWVTEYSPYEPAGQILYQTPQNIKNVFMDRNLGAMDTVYNSAGNFPGIPYQFGNKNPNVFRETTYWDVNNVSHSGETITSGISPATTVLRPRESIPAMLHAMRYPILGVPSGMIAVTVEEPYIWRTKGGNKTAYDPCPEGYRVPQQESSGALSSPWYGAIFQQGTGIFQEGFYSNDLNYFPRNYINGGSGSNVTVFNGAYYWTSFWDQSIPNNADAYGMSVISATPVATNPFAATHKATGGYIRCTVDKNYLERRLGNKFGRYAADILNNL